MLLTGYYDTNQAFFFFACCLHNLKMKVTIMSYVTNLDMHYIVYMVAHSYPDSNSVINSNHELLSSFEAGKGNL